MGNLQGALKEAIEVKANMIFLIGKDTIENKEKMINLSYLNEIALKIINREIVPDTYFNFIENPIMIDNINTYNQKTYSYKLSFRVRAIHLLEEYYGVDIGIYTFHRASTDTRGIVNNFAQYALYKNSLELMYGDAEFAQTFFHVQRQKKWDEKSMDNPWASFLNNKEWLNSEYCLDGFNEYCALIDGITADLQKEGAFVDNNIFIDKILNREIIQDTYINFIESPEISEAIKEYNKLTAQYILEQTPVSITLMITQSELETLDVEYDFNYFEKLDEVRMFSAQISTYSLYGNRDALIYAIPNLVFDTGSGVGQWPRFLQHPQQEEFEHYLEMVDSLIISLK